jgi:hypothetical protein
VRSDCNVEIIADNVDVFVARMRDNVYLRIPDKEVSQETAHRELHCRDGRCATHRAGWFIQPVPDSGLSLFGLTQHRDRMPVEFPVGVGHSEPARRAIEQPDPEIGL